MQHCKLCCPLLASALLLLCWRTEACTVCLLLLLLLHIMLLLTLMDRANGLLAGATAFLQARTATRVPWVTLMRVLRNGCLVHAGTYNHGDVLMHR